MLKKSELLAGAVAAAAAVLSGGAFAGEAKGALYGDIRYSIDYSEDNSATAGPYWTTTDNNSLWGVKASTTQGGLTVFGNYERFLDVDGQIVIEFTRYAYAGVKGGFGTIEYGQHTTDYADAGIKLDPFYNTTVTGTGGLGAAGSIFGGGNSHGTSVAFNGDLIGGSYVPDQVAYRTPSFGGFTVNTMMVFDESGSEDQNHVYGLGGEFNNAGITAGIQLIDDNNGTWLAVDEEAARLYGGFATDQFGVGASFERHDLAAGATDADFLMLSGWFGVMPGTRVAASWGSENETGGDGDSIRLGVFHDVIDNFTIWAAGLRYDGDEGNGDADVLTVGASYKFNLGFSATTSTR